MLSEVPQGKLGTAMTGLRSPPYHRFCEYQQTVEDWSVYLCQGTCSNRIRHSRSPVGCKGFIRARVTGSDGLVPGDERIWWRQTCFSIVRNLLIVCFPPKLPFFLHMRTPALWLHSSSKIYKSSDLHPYGDGYTQHICIKLLFRQWKTTICNYLKKL